MYSAGPWQSQPALVFPDADVEQTAREIVDLKSTNAGQVCVSPDRVFVHETVVDRFAQIRELSLPVRLHSGSVSVNGPKYEFYLPHGGTKESGVGKDCSPLSLEEYYYVQRISIRTP